MMPHCVDWTAADWEAARATALVHALCVESPTAAMLAELRVRETQLGVTMVGRARLGIRYETADPTPRPRRSRRTDLRLVDALEG